MGKKLFTNHDDGEKVSLTCFRNVKDEAIEIGSIIDEEISARVILICSNYLSQAIACKTVTWKNIL